MSIRSREEALLKKWEEQKKKEGSTDFTCDGVVDEKTYNASRRKIAFVLKEYPHTGHEDLRTQLRDGLGYMLWCKIAYITYLIRQFDMPKYEQQEPENWGREFRSKMHRSICAVNLDKVGGNTSTDMMKLALIAMKDRKFIQHQFAIYGCDLIICCGTFDIFRYVLGHETMEIQTEGQTQWYERTPKKYVVEIPHPSYPGFGYDSIKERVAEIEKICRKRKPN